MKLFSILGLFLVGCCAEGANILAIFPYQGRSHNIMFEPLMMGLAHAGHSVDVVSHFPPERQMPGFNHISLKGTVQSDVNNLTISVAQTFTLFNGVMHAFCYQRAKDLCDLMKLPQLQSILDTETKYDILITEIFGTNCYLAVAHKLKVPVIGVVSATLYPWAYDPFFGSDNPSYIPSHLSGFASEMTFMERVENLVVHVVSKLLFYYYDKIMSEPLARQYVDGLPSLNDIYFNMSLVLVNDHRSISGVRPNNPAVIEVAGLHIDETQKLSEESEVFLNSAEDGVVYFSMGSMIKPESFSAEKIQAIYQSFAELSNYKVLWKGKAEEMPEGIPANIKIVPWASQYATLRHPNVKAFVTHGGLMGTQEAIHAGVPMIGIPFFGEQATNIAGYVQQGIAVRLNYEDITKDSFSNALCEVLTNSKYKSNIEHVSRLFKDRPLSPMDEAVYWVEYVIRNGGESLKSSALHLYWFQYYLIDIGLFLLAITTLVLISLFMVIRKVLGAIVAIDWSTFSVKQKTM